MSKQLKFNDEARESLREGINILANAVKCTLGPKGRTVLIEDFNGPHITKDGVTVAKSVELEDKFQNMGAQLVKQVASKTCDDVGDGTTTSTVLAQAIIQEGLKNLAVGASPVDLKRGIDAAVKIIVEYIKQHSIPVENKIKQVATISANNDEEIGEIIAEAFSKVTQDGVITVEEAKGCDTTVETVEGMKFDRGYSSQYFVTDTETMKCELENPCILICDKKISNIKDLLPVLEPAAKQNTPVLIIAEDIESEALNTLVMNKMRAGLKICAVRSPGFGELKSEMIKDIAILTGGEVYSDKIGTGLNAINPEMIGTCTKAIITKNSTTLIGGMGDSSIIKDRICEIKEDIEKASEPYQITQLKDRLAKLSGGVAIIKVGASSEVEMKEKKDRIDDALCAVRAALEEGIVPGGGTIYIRAITDLYDYKIKASSDYELGYHMVFKALEAPLKQIATNAGKCPDIILSEVFDWRDNFGWDAKTDNYVDLVQQGIIDPAKVSRIALENAASVAGLCLTTDCVIVDSPIQDGESRSFFM